MNVEEILHLYLSGLSIRKVSEKTGVDRKKIASILDERGIKIRYRRAVVGWVDDERIRCTVCEIVKHKNDFPFSTSNSRDGYYFSYCKMCRKARQREDRLRRSPWTERVGKIRLRAKRNNIPFDLDAEYLENLWNTQNGNCFYTGYQMKNVLGEGIGTETVSVDKVIPELGYVKTNVVLCTQRANTIKNNLTLEEMKLWMPAWYARIEPLI